MSRAAMAAAWGVLLVSSLAIGGIALRLLGHERERIAGTARAAAMEHADAVAGSIALAVEDVQQGLTDSLLAVREGDRAAVLSDWRRTNPLVRNVFVQDADGRLILPDPDRPGTDEAAGFLARYAPLLEGRMPWAPPVLDRPAGPDRPGDAPAEAAASAKSFRSQRAELVALTRPAPAADQTDLAPGSPRAGWLPWTWQNRLHLLGWVQDDRGRYGIELEVMAVLARLVESIPDPTYADGVLALLDDRGQVMHQRGSAVIEPASTPRLAAVPIGEVLPHWQVAVYAPGGTASPAGGQAMVLVTGLVVATFVCAILAGGGLLAWQAHRHLRDAQQKTSFVSNVSHELKTPLTTIRMYAELMGEQRVTDPAKQARYLSVIVDESRRLTRLVNNVLDFSRLEQGRKKYRREPLDLWDVLRELLTTHQPRVDRAGMRMACSVPSDPCRVHIDRDALEQALLNVLDNAIKYADQGGRLRIEGTIEDGRARIGVLDRGPGIPPAQAELIFRKFHRVDDSLTAARTGSGLGLPIARRLLRDQGGDLVYTPRDGGGACFRLVLPLAGGDRGAAEAAG